MKRYTLVLLTLSIAAILAAELLAAGTAHKSVPKIAAAAAENKIPPSALPLKFVEHEHIALVGNSLAERMNLFGNFEALLHTRFPKLELVVRNFARPCDAVDDRQRPNDYTALDDPLKVFAPDTFICFFGFNEAFAGKDGESHFREAYGNYLDSMTKQYTRADGTSPRLVLVSPAAWEPTGNPLWPNADDRNEPLANYSKIVAEIAKTRGLAYVDLFTPTKDAFAKQPGMQYTINGCHLNEAGDRVVAAELDRQLFGESTTTDLNSDAFQKFREAINDKSWI